MQQESSEKEAHQYAAPASHRDDGYECTRNGERVEIEEVGRCEEKTDAHNAPAPTECCGVPACRPPEEEENEEHQCKLVIVEP